MVYALPCTCFRRPWIHQVFLKWCRWSYLTVNCRRPPLLRTSKQIPTDRLAKEGWLPAAAQRRPSDPVELRATGGRAASCRWDSREFRQTLRLAGKKKTNAFSTAEKIDINPLTPRRTQVSHFTEIWILFIEGIIKKISYERRAYESVDEKSLS